MYYAKFARKFNIRKGVDQVERQYLWTLSALTASTSFGVSKASGGTPGRRACNQRRGCKNSQYGNQKVRIASEITIWGQLDFDVKYSCVVLQ